jgi:hypothetical protein
MNKLIQGLEAIELEKEPTSSQTELYFLIDKVESIKDHIHAFKEQLSVSNDHKKQLHEALSIIKQLQQDRLAFYRATSLEIQQAFDLISNYATVLEDKILQHNLDPNHQYDFDDVSESGENLKFIANSFYLLSAYENQQYTPSAIPSNIPNILHELVHILEPNITRRNVHFTSDIDDRLSIFTTDEVLVRHLLWVLCYLAINFAADESEISLIAAKNDNDMTLSIKVTGYDRNVWANKETDYRPFLPIRYTEELDMLMHLFRHHVNSLITQSVLGIIGGHYTIQTLGDKGYSLHIDVPEMIN